MRVAAISPQLCWYGRKMVVCACALTTDSSTVRPGEMPFLYHALSSPWTHCLVLAGFQPWTWLVVTIRCQLLRLPKTAFCTPFGLFEWNRMPFGLCNAPSTFQRLMQHIFGDQQCRSLLLYLDDIVVFSSTVEQHMERLQLVLQWEGLKAKLSKCSFFRKDVH